jgi:hypothetical protein
MNSSRRLFIASSVGALSFPSYNTSHILPSLPIHFQIPIAIAIMPIVFWAIVYIESISGAAKKLVTALHLDHTHTIDNLSMDGVSTIQVLHGHQLLCGP